MHSKHDDVVGHPGAFDETADAIDFLIPKNISCFVTTVVTPLNINDIDNIAAWSFSKGVTKYYLFALMKSGYGKKFIDANGEVSPEQISIIQSGLASKYSKQRMDIIYYDYKHNAECILIYGDGRVVIDPYPESETYQLEIGNIFSDTREEIISNFSKDGKNLRGHRHHLDKHDKKIA